MSAARRPRTGMRPSAVVSEAWRNVLAGVTRAGALALAFVILCGGLVVADVRGVVSVIQGADEYRAAGASVQVLSAPEQIDGERCEALARIDGIESSGALRHGESVRALNLPSSELATFEATPGLATVLRADGGGEGLWLPDELAQTLGAHRGDTLTTDRGDAVVGATYAYPSDGRDRTYSYAVTEVVPAAGLFDYCWAEVWPASSATAAYLRTAVDADPAAEQQPTLGPLNGTLGAAYDAPVLLAERITRHAPWAALAVGAAIGAVGVWIRRLELAAALHARVPRAAMLWQVLIETAAWVGAATFVLAMVISGAATWGNPDPGFSVWLIGMRTVSVGAVGVLCGALAAVLVTREKHLFRYFKDV